ncbi:hypothetical protein SK069_17250 [Patulibacter brassicae]|uniref:Uncharacterized protein n=1 Tax=Patulibacter brassicae TaxID=1705717 RepID=A0ABU4VQH6_9ACTN|nr:hypothetical protein [Patulibacter brassicae]MDX8153349.1 hypothetical protein [Patulibacter brassicae]
MIDVRPTDAVEVGGRRIRLPRTASTVGSGAAGALEEGTRVTVTPRDGAPVDEATALAVAVVAAEAAGATVRVAAPRA